MAYVFHLRYLLAVFLIDNEPIAHFGNILAADQLVDVFPLRRFRQCRRHLQPLFVNRKMKCVVARTRNNGETLHVVIAQYHIRHIRAVECSRVDHLVDRNTVERIEERRRIEYRCISFDLLRLVLRCGGDVRTPKLSFLHHSRLLSLPDLSSAVPRHSVTAIFPSDMHRQSPYWQR